MDYERMPLLKRVLVSLCMTLLYVLRLLSDYLAFPALSAFKSGRSKLQPRVDEKILLMSASDLAEKIRSGELSSHQVVLAFVKRLREIDPLLNAVTDERYRAALSEAKKVDAELKECRSDEEALQKIKLQRPYLGVPITTKNALAVKDLGNEAGLYLKKGTKSPSDSYAISVMRASGAIPLAVTNTPEMCLWMESNNKLFGRTSNPYNLYRTCGGSSGGEGAILASCGSPFGIGTDIAGSIRVPAAYNGVFGLKPTINTVDMTGHYPMPKDILYPLLIAGPMCKYAKDLRPFLKALVGPETAKRMNLDSRPSLRKLKVLHLGDFHSSIITPVKKEIAQRTKSAALHLASLSKSDSQSIVIPKIAHAFEIYMTYMTKAKCPPLAEELAMLKGSISLKRETVKYLIGRSKHTMPALFVAYLEKLVQNSKDSSLVKDFYRMSLDLQAEVETLLGEDGILVCPTLPDIAPYHGLTILRPSILAHTGIWNILGFPAVSVPMGLSKKGMPIGVTVVAGKFKDNICCEVALELERQFGGWVPPFETSIENWASLKEQILL
ncbi:fatty-acid amide hydrolase 2-B [Galendromus occidentalis]|uniref:Fatty-acid amide hydrolase 2-B n=1 Tax=Galendromus occidentalis TaxID=34638 RepID=A0AAJ6VZQ1_9ACAR|nr:fatty-acid amide hydrolase 2-B [Galendromus occidentalis]